MNKVEKLIAELCPEGVEVKTLGEVAEVGTGSSNGNEATENGRYPLFVRSKFVKSIDTFEFDEEAILIPGEGGVGEIFHYINGKYALHQRAYRIHFITNEINAKYTYHYFFEKFKAFILKNAVTATVISIRKPMIEKFAIPIPPLAIQQEIVKILDTFTTLEAELEARKKQYVYYRDELLTFGEDMEWKTLGEAIALEYGKPLKESERGGGNFPVLGSNGRIGFHNSYLIEGPCIIIGRKGSAGAVVWEEKNCYPIDTTFFVKNQNDNILLKYLFYIFQTLNLAIDKQDGGVPGLNRNNVYKIKIPIPPLSEQHRIVAILDKFDALVNGTTPSPDGATPPLEGNIPALTGTPPLEGNNPALTGTPPLEGNLYASLPAELNARRKQYEYYRGKLLTFKEKYEP